MTGNMRPATTTVRQTLPQHVRRTIIAIAALFLALLALVTTSLIMQGRQTALNGLERDAIRFVSGAESTLNGNLLSIDILLASMGEVLQASNLVLDWLDNDLAARQMRAADNQNLLVSQLSLITP